MRRKALKYLAIIGIINEKRSSGTPREKYFEGITPWMQSGTVGILLCVGDDVSERLWLPTSVASVTKEEET